MTYTVRASDRVTDLMSDGIEYLLDRQGEVIAIFIDGMLNGRLKVVIEINTDETVIFVKVKEIK